MNAQLLIDAIVRQVTVLIAQLATAGGIRAPLAHVANQVFADLANELAAQGVSRKVSADMFGMALRAYIRKIQRLNESSTEHGRTLWSAVLDFLSRGSTSRDDVMRRFHRDDEVKVRAVLHDLVESGLVFAAGSGNSVIYRVADDSELARLRQSATDAGLDELVWALIYREGPLDRDALGKRARVPAERLDASLQRLSAHALVMRSEAAGRDLYTATEFSIPLGVQVGWEAAVFDHVQAVVQTICQRLRSEVRATSEADLIGGSTYTFDVWPGHPLEAEVRGALREFRQKHGALRARVEQHNRAHARPRQYEQVVVYGGQCVLAQGEEREDV